MRGSIRSAAAATLFACLTLGASARGQDFSYDILPPGQFGNLPTTVHSTDQRASLWTAMQQASAELAAAQGPDPSAWREPAPRIQFIPGLIPETMRFTNRSTFQQVIRFARRRP